MKKILISVIGFLCCFSILVACGKLGEPEFTWLAYESAAKQSQNSDGVYVIPFSDLGEYSYSVGDDGYLCSKACIHLPLTLSSEDCPTLARISIEDQNVGFELENADIGNPVMVSWPEISHSYKLTILIDNFDNQYALEPQETIQDSVLDLIAQIQRSPLTIEVSFESGGSTKKSYALIPRQGSEENRIRIAAKAVSQEETES